jgi:hypothetical protein
MQERLVDVVPPLITDREPTVLGDPRQCALDGLITKDKFCMTRYGRLALSWFRYLKSMARQEIGEPVDPPTYPPTEVTHRGGAHEAPVARPPKYGGESGRPTPLGPSLPQHHAMEPGDRTDARNGRCAPLQLRRCAGSNRLLPSRLAVGRLPLKRLYDRGELTND